MKGLEDLTPVGHHKWFDSRGTSSPVLQKYESKKNAVELLDVIGLSVIRVTFPPKRLSIVDG